MGIGFFLVGGIIFALFMVLNIWNIIYSNRKQREENYASYPAFLEKLKAESQINGEEIDPKDIEAIEKKYKNINIG